MPLSSCDGKAGGQDRRARRPACKPPFDRRAAPRAAADPARARCGRRRGGRRRRSCLAPDVPSASHRSRHHVRAGSHGIEENLDAAFIRHSRALRRASICTSRAAAVLRRPAGRRAAADPSRSRATPRLTIRRWSSPRRAGRSRSPTLLADVTVIGAEEIARQRRAKPRRAAAAPARRRDRAERRAGVDLRRVPARRQSRPDAGAGRRPARRRRRRTGTTALEAIPLDQIERIEILRGPASSLYGADAIGGVIQVFTRARRRRRAAQRERRLRHLRHVGRRRGRQRRERPRGVTRLQVGAHAQRRLQRDRQSGAISASTTTATAIATTASAPTAATTGRRAGARRAVLPQPARRAVRRRRHVRRPHDHDARKLRDRQRQPAGAVRGRRG